MERIIESPFKNREKISLNINTEMLNLVKDLAKLTKTDNTLMIECLLVNGVPPLIKQFKTSWATLLGDTKEESRKKILKETLEELKKISEKEEYQPFLQ